jgi:IS30 family transposase
MISFKSDTKPWPVSEILTRDKVNAVAELINNQRRRSLGYQSPAALYAALTVQ